jgi:hypothetical protein
MKRAQKRTRRPLTASAKADLATRKDNLARLGFSSYQAYLRSSLWAEIRARVLERDERTCRFCKRPASQVHHGNYFYLTMSGENINYLFATCGPCHFRGSFSNKKGVLLSSRSATKRMKRGGRRRRNGRVKPRLSRRERHAKRQEARQYVDPLAHLKAEAQAHLDRIAAEREQRTGEDGPCISTG